MSNSPPPSSSSVPGTPSGKMTSPPMMGSDGMRSASIRSLTRRQSFARTGMQTSFKFSAALAEAQATQEDEVEFMEALRLSVKKFLTGSRTGMYIEVSLSVLNVLFSMEYIYKTYLVDTDRTDRNQSRVLSFVELIFAGIFFAEWSMNYFIADHKILYIISFFSVVDLMTVVSIMVTFWLNEPEVGDIHTLGGACIYAMFAMNTVRILKALRIKQRLVSIDDAVQRYLGEISVNISVMILFFAAIMQFLEKRTLDLEFHTWIWFIWVTISTVGYGDISPLTAQGRLATMAIIGFSIVSIPKMTNELIEKMNLQSVFARASYTPRTRFNKHIVICGDLSSTSTKDFMDELFHEDHDNNNLSAVFLLPIPPSKEILLLMRDPKFFLSLTYLEGSALVDEDLKRAKIESAVALFIMTNKFSAYPDEEDKKSILLNLSVKRYIANFNLPPKLYCLQLIRPQNRRHLGKEEVETKVSNNLVVCLNEIKMGILAKAVMFPGANTLLMNLISSFSDDPLNLDNDEESEEVTINEIDPETGVTKRVPVKAWMQEYEKGCDWEIYTSRLARIFIGSKFSEVSFALYQKFGVVLFALQITDKYRGNEARILLNPAKFVIPDDSRFDVLGFVMAQNKASSDLTFHDDFISAHDDTVFNNHSMGDHQRGLLNALPHKLLDRIAIPGQTDRSNAAAPQQKLHSESNESSGAQLDSGSDDLVGSKGGRSGGGSSGKRFTLFSRNDETMVKTVQNRVKRSNSLERSFDSLSYQEILYQLKDKHFVSNYYLRTTPADLDDVMVKTSVRDIAPDINNHVVIVGKGLRNLFDLIKPLRARYLGALRHIVILTPVDIPHDIWQRIAMFDAVLVIKGSPMEERHLRRAGIFRAQRVVVLADGGSGNGEHDQGGTLSSSVGMSALVDSDAIFSYQRIKRMNPNAQVVVEIINTSNINYIDKDLTTASVADYKFSSQFAAGTLFTTGLLDSIVCQAYYNPHIVQVLQKLISGVDQMERDELIAEAAEHAEERLRRRRRRRLRRRAFLRRKGSSRGRSNSSMSSESSGNSDHHDTGAWAAVTAGEGGEDEDDMDDDDDDDDDDGGDDDNDGLSDSSGELEGDHDEEEAGDKMRKSSKLSNSSSKRRVQSAAGLMGGDEGAASAAGEPRRVGDIQGSCLYQMPLPPVMVKQTYGALYQYLALSGLIPLGLLRGVDPATKNGPKANKMPYVYTNPTSDSLLYSVDRVFVLSCKPVDKLNIATATSFTLPSKAGKLKSGLDSIVGAALSASRGRGGGGGDSPGGGTRSGASSPAGSSRPPARTPSLTASSAPAESTIATANIVSSEAFAELARSQGKLEDRFKRLSRDVHEKFDTIITMLGKRNDEAQANYGTSTMTNAPTNAPSSVAGGRNLETSKNNSSGWGKYRQHQHLPKAGRGGDANSDGDKDRAGDDSSLSSRESAQDGATTFPSPSRSETKDMADAGCGVELYASAASTGTSAAAGTYSDTDTGAGTGTYGDTRTGAGASTCVGLRSSAKVVPYHYQSSVDSSGDAAGVVSLEGSMSNSLVEGGSLSSERDFPAKDASNASKSTHSKHRDKLKLKIKPSPSPSARAGGGMAGPTLDSTKRGNFSRSRLLAVDTQTNAVVVKDGKAISTASASSVSTQGAGAKRAKGAKGVLPEVDPSKHVPGSVALEDDLLSLESSVGHGAPHFESHP